DDGITFDIDAQRLNHPTLLDLPATQVQPYPPATVIAEKFQATLTLGVPNGRMKDYHDLWARPRAIDISDDDLDAAIRATFERRGTPIPNGRPQACRPRWPTMKGSKGNGTPTPPRSSSTIFRWKPSSKQSGI